MFITFLLHSYLKQTELMLYVQQIFSPTLEKMCSYSAIAKEKRLNIEHELYEKFSYHAKEKHKNEQLQLNEMIMFCDELFEVIIRSLVFMPESGISLIKTIWLVAKELVRFIKFIDC